MNVFEQLSDAQQRVLLLQGANRGTCKSLARMGLITFTESAETASRTVELTDLGLMVLFAHSQRHNTSDLFSLGERVITLDFNWQNSALRFYGRDVIVTKLTPALVTVQMNSYQVRRHPFNVARYADVEAAGLLGLVRPDPLAVQP